MKKTRICFICYKVCNPDPDNVERLSDRAGNLFEAEENVSVKEQLSVLLLLRNFLCIPQEKCCNLLKNYGNPSSWIYWCNTCSVVVTEAENISHQLKLLKGQLSTLQAELKKSIVESEYKAAYYSQDVINQMENRPTEILRSYIIQNGDLSNVDVEVQLVVDAAVSEDEKYNCSWDNSMSHSDTSSDCSSDVHSVQEDLKTQKASTLPRIRRSIGKPKTRSGKRFDENNHDPMKKNLKSKATKNIKVEVAMLDAEKLEKSLPEIPTDEDFDSESDEEYTPDKSSKKSKKASNKKKSGDKEKRYKCKICQKAYTHKSDRWRHQNRHSGIRPFKCPMCPKAFFERKDLNQHNKTHTGERPFECSFCEKAFPRKAEWKMHELLHTGEKPCICSVCGEAFRNLKICRRHQIREHSETPVPETNATIENSYTCCICDKRFSEEQTLKKHMCVHETFLKENPKEIPVVEID